MKKIEWGKKKKKRQAHERQYDSCQICGRYALLDRHHIVFSSQGGLEDETNYLFVCRFCHSSIHHGSISIEEIMYRKEHPIKEYPQE